MKPADVKENMYIDFGKEVNDKNPKFKISDHVKISKYKKIFAKGYTTNWPKEVFIIKNVAWTYVISNLNVEEIIRTFYEKELQKNKSRSIQNRKSN